MASFPRLAAARVKFSLENFPITALIGPRQCGKSTLARQIAAEHGNADFIDLEKPSDQRKFADPELFLSSRRGRLVILDEIQRQPELFPLLRSLADEWDANGSFLVLGSASRDLLRQSSESLAGRVNYVRLTAFLWDELAADPDFSFERYLARGSFPRSFLAKSDAASFAWRESFIATFLERDLLQWSGFSPQKMARLWQMLAHLNGQILNYAALAAALEISAGAARNYVDLLASAFMVEVVPPYLSNLGKRLQKAPKMFVADAGLTAALLGLRSFDAIAGHPVFGALWEQLVLTHLRFYAANSAAPSGEIFHYHSVGGAEIDFVIRMGERIFAIECKASLSPRFGKGNYSAIADIKPVKTLVVTPGADSYPLAAGVEVVPLRELRQRLAE